jgi:hypothetical protein
MAAKKAAKKGDEPVRVGRAKAQRTSGILKDPYGYTSGKNMNKAVTEEVANRMRVGKQKYGTNYVVEVSMDGVVRTKAGASKKAQKAQSSRMTGQAKKAASNSSGEQLMSRKEHNSRSGDLSGYGFNAVGRTLQRSRDQSKRADKKDVAAQAKSSRVNLAPGASRVKAAKNKK